MKATRGVSFTQMLSRLAAVSQTKSWMAAIGICAVIAGHGMACAESAAPPVVNRQEAVKKVTQELDQDNRATESEKIIAVADSLLGVGLLPFISAQEVFNQAIETGGRGLFLLTVQDSDDYAKGHVPGAVNIPYHGLAKKSALARIPKDRKVVVVGDNGHSANAASLFLNQLGYDTTPMVMGMNAWNAASPGLGKQKPYAGSAGYAVSMESTPPPDATNEVPAVTTGKETVAEIIIARTDAYLSSQRPLEIASSEVYEKAVVMGDPGYFLLSIQRAEDYGKGHVPGAINIPYNEIAKKESLAKLPRDKKIVVICYIGHFAGAVAMLLNQLGYEAYDMRYGTMGWNDTTEGLGPRRQYLAAMFTSQGYPIIAGSRK